MTSFYPSGPITGDVWQDYCDTIASDLVRYVLATSVGTVEVNMVQRRAMSLALKAQPHVSVAVVTDEAIVRGLMTAVSWLGRVDVKAFPWHKIAEAHRNLKPEGISERQALDMADKTRRRVEASRAK